MEEPKKSQFEPPAWALYLRKHGWLRWSLTIIVIGFATYIYIYHDPDSSPSKDHTVPQITEGVSKFIKTFFGPFNVAGYKVIIWSYKDKKYVRLEILELFDNPKDILSIQIDDAKNLTHPDKGDHLFITAFYKDDSIQTIQLKHKPFKDREGFYITVTKVQSGY